MAGWIKMALGMDVGLGTGHVVLDGDPAPLPQKRTEAPIFGLFLLWPNGCMYQDTLKDTAKRTGDGRRSRVVNYSSNFVMPSG